MGEPLGGGTGCRQTTASAKISREGKTFYNIEDYDRVRALFGELLREVQRIKSQGDYAAAKALVEGYGVQVDPNIHQEVLTRSEALGIAPYGGFINPQLEAVTNEAGDILEVNLTYPDDFTEQMLGYDDTVQLLAPRELMQATEAKPLRANHWRSVKLALIEAVLLLEQEEDLAVLETSVIALQEKHPCQAVGDWVSAQWECGAQATLSRSTTSYPTRPQTR